MRNFFLVQLAAAFLLFASCNGKTQSSTPNAVTIAALKDPCINADNIRTIHVLVALCDNKYQSIVPVPVSIGNGQDPATNLYWGAAFGVKTYFLKRTSDWQLLSVQPKPSAWILERALFKHVNHEVYLLADAYDGREIKQTTLDFFRASSGRLETAIATGNKTIYFGGASNLLAYVGHDGLMDFSIQEELENDDGRKTETIILACYSKRFFGPHLASTGAKPLLWSTGLMAPEAYVLHDAIGAWINHKAPADIRLAAAKAYSKYQKCSLKAAKNLLVSGW